MNSVAIDPCRVRDRAYARWQERGCPSGSAEQDWFDAERAILLEESSRESAALPPRAASADMPRAQLTEGPLAAPVLAAPVRPLTKETGKRVKPPRPTLKRAPTTRAAKLLNEVAPKAPPETRAQKAIAAAAAATAKRSAVGSG